MTDCVFCRVLAGSLPASPVYEDTLLLAFLDIAPATPGHLLVVPKEHVERLADLPEDTGAHLFRVAHRLIRGMSGEGANLFLADGEVAGQEVPHVHLHVIPRRADDGFRVTADWQHPSREELDATAAVIRDAVNALRRR